MRQELHQFFVLRQAIITIYLHFLQSVLALLRELLLGTGRVAPAFGGKYVNNTILLIYFDSNQALSTHLGQESVHLYLTQSQLAQQVPNGHHLP